MINKDLIGKPVQGRLSFFEGNPGVRKFLMIIAAIVFATSCSDEDDEPKKVVLIDATSILTRSASELRTFLGASAIDIDLDVIQYDVEIFKVTYKTTYKDSEIVASGLVVLPETNDDDVEMVSFQHGTIASWGEAPTALAINNTQLILYAALSSAGFITVVPDFIGFGESKDILHPYYVEQATADAVIDNLRAARELAREEGLTFNKKLFLAGYSQGGYATMATHKSIEENGLDDFDLQASFPSSGGYDIKGMQEYFFSLPSYQEPFYISYVALAYQSYYDWEPASLGEFFNEPYASRIPGLFNGINTAGNINAQLTESIPDLITADLLATIDTDAQYDYLVNAFNENSLLDWTPTVPMFMYHGDADVTVPYQNSVDTYQHFIANGASASVVTFTTLAGADHGSGIIPYVEDFFNKLLLIR